MTTSCFMLFSNFFVFLFRNKDNLDGWNSQMGGKANVKFVLFFNCTEDVCVQRIMKRSETSGRSDDNMDSLKLRFNTYRAWITDESENGNGIEFDFWVQTTVIMDHGFMVLTLWSQLNNFKVLKTWIPQAYNFVNPGTLFIKLNTFFMSTPPCLSSSISRKKTWLKRWTLIRPLKRFLKMCNKYLVSQHCRVELSSCGGTQHLLGGDVRQTSYISWRGYSSPEPATQL